MNSKKLNSILNNIPSATISGQNQPTIYHKDFSSNIEQESKIVARIPMSLKEEIRQYIKNHKGMNERVLVLKALQKLGFKILDEWLIDKRTVR